MKKLRDHLYELLLFFEAKNEEAHELLQTIKREEAQWESKEGRE